jgi:hypothetical protein
VQNWEQQPSKQLIDLLRWLFEEVGALHGRGGAHGGLSLNTISCRPGESWALAPPADTPDAPVDVRRMRDVQQLARIACFLCLSFSDRRLYQPHHLPELSDEQLLAAVSHVPDVRLLAAAQLRGAVSVSDAMAFHLWHPLAVHAQVLQDTKAVMRSMRLGSEDFDAHYGALVLRGADWRAELGGSLIPAVVAASREHVVRADFAAYDYRSAASLLRFTANTIGHFEELALGLQARVHSWCIGLVCALALLAQQVLHLHRCATGRTAGGAVQLQFCSTAAGRVPAFRRAVLTAASARLQVTKAALLANILSTFPGLVPACYHYLSTYPSLHVYNRDCNLVRRPPSVCATFCRVRSASRV